MLSKAFTPLFIVFVGAAFAAKTDLTGCSLSVVPLLTEIVTTTVNGVVSSFGNYAYTTFQWDGIEQCQLIDCGGGRAPPRTTQPGCPGYSGTDTVPSLPFPTASLTLNQAAATTSAASDVSVAVGAAATPAATSSSPATNTGTPAAASGSSNAVPATASGTPSPTVTPPSSSVADLNPTLSSNSGVWLGGNWVEATMGLAAVAALHVALGI